MKFSLKAVVDVLDSYPELTVIDKILELYNKPRAILFNDKFIPMADAMVVGYIGFKAILYSLMETSEEFLESCLPELRALLQALSGKMTEEW